MKKKSIPEGEEVRLNLAADIADRMGCAVTQALPLTTPHSAADHEDLQPGLDDEEPDYGKLGD